MKMTTKGKYAVSIMCELAGVFAKDGNVLLSREIAKKLYMSQLYVEQILNKLKKAGLVKAIRGPHGGYVLTNAPKQITIGSVIEATEGPISLARCVEKGVGKGCSLAPQCKTKKFWSELSRVIENKLDGTTLADLC